jgi:predicted RNase H-like nuclease
MPLVAGVDGCRHGWVVVVISFPDNETVSVARVSSLTEVTAPLDSGLLAAVGVDMPIGLPDLGPRACDVEARKMIGPRRNSVFPAPIRPLLAATTWEEANAISRDRCGKGMSQQAFGILPKVAEADSVVTPERQQRLIEVHPEVSFSILAGSPMAFHKAKAEGRAERLAALRPVFPEVDVHASVRLPGVHDDDVLDAYAAVWSAGRWLSGDYVRLGGGIDQRGIRMEIIA